jgi:hypothetical protein
MVLSGMSDVGLIAILLAAFLLAIGLVRLLDRLIGSGAPDDGWADGPPDTNGTDPAGSADGTSTIADPGGPQ